MANKNDHQKAMLLLGTTNILKTLLLFIQWILRPEKAVKLAKDITSDIKAPENKQPRIIAIGYINEFFSKYLEFGKTKREIVEINESIDRGIITTNKIANTLIKLRGLRKKLNKLSNKTYDQIIPTKKEFGISQGIVTGTALNFRNTRQIVPKNCIGIFPTSGVKYTTQFLKCIGIIFINGSMTSHGAILARESGIPAVVSPNTKIKDSEIVEINGTTGTVKRVVDRGN